MAKNQPKVSVIIPVYNVEKYLHHCLDSVLNQSMNEIEIICVEDCSTDSSADILREYESKDARVKCVYHSQNRGLTVTRRDGVQISTGEYILFLDSDDFISGVACASLYKQIKKKNVDILMFGTNVVPHGSVEEEILNGLDIILKPYCGLIVSDRKGTITNACYKDQIFRFTIWNKMYRGDIVRHAVSYLSDEGFNMAEDAYLFFLISFFSKSFSGVENKYHFYNFGAGMTGGNRQETDASFREKNRRGLIINEMRKFANKMAPDGFLDDGLDVLETAFFKDWEFKLFQLSDNINKSKAIRDALNMHEKSKVISELCCYFRCIPWNQQRNFINSLSPNEIFDNPKREVKTVATFYHRMNNGGVERVLAQLLAIWRNAGYNVVLFTDDAPSHLDYEYPKDVTRIILPSTDCANKEDMEVRVSYLQDMLKKYEVDVMVYHAWLSPQLMADMFAVKSMGVSFIEHVHGAFHCEMKSLYSGTSHCNILLNQLVKFFDATVVLSEVDMQWLKVCNSNIYKTSNPLSFDLKSIKTVDLSQNKDLIWVGRISPEKNLPHAFRILRTVLDRGYKVKLHVVGEAYDKNYHNEMLNLIKELDISKYVIMHGFQTDVSSFYEKTGIHVMTSEFEGFGMVLAESKAYGLPTVMYDIPSLEFVRDGRGMEIVPHYNYSMAAEKIIEILNDDEKRILLGKEARQSVEDICTIDYAKLWGNVFDAAIQEKKPGRTDSTPLQIAIDMLLDFTDRGLETREANRYITTDVACAPVLEIGVRRALGNYLKKHLPSFIAKALIKVFRLY